MNTYQKLNLVRATFHEKPLKKSGLNKFAGYQYFELADFLVPALQLFGLHGLTATISFGLETATMTIVNSDKPDDAVITLTSPMSEAALKGCHPVQNLGAVQTYLTRYLWVQALCIVEHDSIDATTGKDTPTHKPTRSTSDLVEDDRKKYLLDLKVGIESLFFENDDIVGAYAQCQKVTDAEEKTYLWDKLDSKVRSAIKKHGESLKGA